MKNIDTLLTLIFREDCQETAPRGWTTPYEIALLFPDRPERHSYVEMNIFQLVHDDLKLFLKLNGFDINLVKWEKTPQEILEQVSSWIPEESDD